MGTDYPAAHSMDTVVPALAGAAIIWKAIPQVVLRRLHSDGICVHCRRLMEFPEYEEFTAFRRSFFQYESADHGPVSGPYVRETLPERPMHIDELPPEIQQAMAPFRRSDVSFREAAVIQPAEWWPCNSWQSAWLATDGYAIHWFLDQDQWKYESVTKWLAEDPARAQRYCVDPIPYNPSDTEDG